MKRQNTIYKIAYSALFIAMTIILSRFVAIPGLFGLPFLKISFANTIVIFSSLYLGPIYGLLVASLSDIFGALLFPQGGAFNPIYTIPAALTGLFPYFIYKFTSNFKVDKKFPVTLTIILASISTFITVYLFTNEYIPYNSKKFLITDTIRYTLSLLSIFISILFISVNIVLQNKFKYKKFNSHYSVFLITTSVFLTYFLFKIPVSSLIKSFMLNYTFEVIFVSQCFVGFFSSIIHSILIALLLEVSLVYKKPGEVGVNRNNNEDVIYLINGENYGRRQAKRC